jgi:hypothetical protein
MVLFLAEDLSNLIWELQYPDEDYLEPWSYYNNLETSHENYVKSSQHRI